MDKTAVSYEVDTEGILEIDEENHTFRPLQNGDVTVTVYNADDTIHAAGTDSVESYIARAGENALNAAIMKFATSALNYLT